MGTCPDVQMGHCRASSWIGFVALACAGCASGSPADLPDAEPIDPDAEPVVIPDAHVPPDADLCLGVPLPGPASFAFTGASQIYTVPACVDHVAIEVTGAQGNGPQGGLGGTARGELAVTAAQGLYVFVGGRNGYNGGGSGNAAIAVNGGGASDVRVGSGDLANRVIVGGGGGGGAQGDVGTSNGGAGGAGTCGANYCGGGAGIGYFGNGSGGGPSGGAGFTHAHAGGAGGGGLASGGQPSCQTYNAPMTCGTAGSLGGGGVGGPYVQATCYTNYGGTHGGGGGYYGGGGSAIGFCGGGGAGGGSSWSGTLTNATFTPAARAGDGVVTITPLD